MKALRSVGAVRRAWRLFGLGCSVAVLSAACGDDDDDDPQSQCETFERTFCNKLVGCSIEEGLSESSSRSADTRECIDELDAVIDCSSAVGVGPTYSECLDDIRSPPCDFVIQQVQSEAGELPDSCNEVILVE